MNEVERVLAERAVRQHQVFSRRQARDAGMSASTLARRVASRRFVAVGTQSLHFAGVELSDRGRLQAGLFDLGPDAVVAGRAAAFLFGLDGFDNCHLEYANLRQHRGRRTAGVVHSVAEFGPLDRLTVDGLACASATLAVIQLFASASAKEATNALDSACRKRLTAVPVIRRRLVEMGRSGRAGVAVFERVVSEAVVDSWLERQFLRLLRKGGLPLPLIQQRHRLDGVGTVRVDFEYAEHGVVIEVGGRLGYMSATERQRKERRRNALQIDGRTVYFFTRDDVVRDPAYVLATVTAALGSNLSRRRRTA